MGLLNLNHHKMCDCRECENHKTYNVDITGKERLFLINLLRKHFDKAETENKDETIVLIDELASLPLL